MNRMKKLNEKLREVFKEIKKDLYGVREIEYLSVLLDGLFDGCYELSSKFVNFI